MSAEKQANSAAEAALSDDRPHLRVAIVTGDRVVYDGPADVLTVEGVRGVISILLHHAPMLTMLEPGELVVRWGDEQLSLAVGGGFLEVVDDTATVLADSAERPEEIDITAAEEARRRAEALMRRYRSRPEGAATALALRRSRVRLRIARLARSRRLP
jgi:F-type H+-transporting ATPase subunit epsilon